MHHRESPTNGRNPRAPQETSKTRTWPRRLYLAALIGLCLAVGGYAGLRIWQWAIVPRDAPLIGVSLDTAWHARAGITSVSYEVALTRAGARTLDFHPGGKGPDEILDRISINEFGTPAEQLDPLPEDWCLDGTLIYRVTGDPHPENSDEIRVTLARGLRDEDVRERLAAQLFALLTGAPHGAITEDWVNRCLDAAHTWADEAYASGRGKPHQSLADARRALRRLLMEPLALSAAPTTTPHATASDR